MYSKTFEFCCQMLQKRVVEWVILSHKNLFLLSVSAFQKKIVMPTSLMQHLNVRLLLTNPAKAVFDWVIFSYKSLFLLNVSAFQKKIVVSTSIMKELNASVCWQMLQELFSGELYFPAKAKFFQVSQHFRRKLCCRHQ